MALDKKTLELIESIPERFNKGVKIACEDFSRAVDQLTKEMKENRNTRPPFQSKI